MEYRIHSIDAKVEKDLMNFLMIDRIEPNKINEIDVYVDCSELPKRIGKHLKQGIIHYKLKLDFNLDINTNVGKIDLLDFSLINIKDYEILNDKKPIFNKRIGIKRTIKKLKHIKLTRYSLEINKTNKKY